MDNGGGDLTFLRPCYDHDEDRMRSLGHPEEADEHQAKQEAIGKRRSNHSIVCVSSSARAFRAVCYGIRSTLQAATASAWYNLVL